MAAEGKPWLKMDLRDLQDGLERGDTGAEVADFLMRREEEVRSKAIELGLLPPDQQVWR
jgi:hypothetical protein